MKESNLTTTDPAEFPDVDTRSRERSASLADAPDGVQEAKRGFFRFRSRSTRHIGVGGADAIETAVPAGAGQATAHAARLRSADWLLTHMVHTLLPTRPVQVDLTLHVRDLALARHVFAQSPWEIIEEQAAEGSRRCTMVLLGQRPAQMPHNRSDQAAMELSNLLNRNRVQVLSMCIYERKPQLQAVYRWTITGETQDPTQPIGGPDAIYTPTDDRELARRLLNDPRVTGRRERVEIADDEKRSRKLARMGVPNFLFRVLALIALIGGAYLGFRQAGGNLSHSFQLYGGIAFGAVTLTAGLWHLSERIIYVRSTEGWRSKHRLRLKPDVPADSNTATTGLGDRNDEQGCWSPQALNGIRNMLVAMSRVDLAVDAAATNQRLQYSNDALIFCMIGISGIFCGHGAHVRDAALLAPAMGFVALLMVASSAWIVVRRLWQPPKLSLGVVGVGSLIGLLALLCHLVAEQFFVGMGVPAGAINMPTSVVAEIALPALGRAALGTLVLGIPWLLIYRRRFAPPQNWLMGAFAAMLSLAACLTALEHAQVQAVEIGYGLKEHAGGFDVTKICVESSAPAQPTAARPTISTKPRPLWLIGNYGTQTILLDPVQAKAAYRQNHTNRWRPGPVTYVPTSTLVYTVIPDGKTTCQAASTPSLASDVTHGQHGRDAGA